MKELPREEGTVHLESGRALAQGIMLLIFAAIAYWINLTIGLALVVFMGLMILQSAFTDWCLSDLFLRPMGLRRKLEGRG